MHLIICNERLLFRFGVDRVLLLLAARLKQAGWKITLIAQRADLAVLADITPHCITPPPYAGPYIDLDQATSAWLESARSQVLGTAAPSSHTVALLGGWPYYGAISVFRRWGVPVVALDCGAVPITGMHGGELAVQERLRARRREFLPEAQLITPISHFIERTQSRRDAGPEVQLTTIHLGSDHLSRPHSAQPWQGADTRCAWPARRGPRILNLGRWETGNYKNSEALYTIARSILAVHPEASFGVLADAGELTPPPELAHCIRALGKPTDEQLVHLMQEADLGLSVSLWEGFNLPLAEMQQLARPVLVFDLGAHPEVAAHPWQCCASAAEMIDKALRILSGTWLEPEQWQHAIARFRTRFTWDNTLAAYQAALTHIVPARDPHWPQLVVDASACLRDPANTGVARVVRSLCRKLQDFGRPLFVAWDEYLQTYVLPTEAEYHNLATYGGPDPNPSHYALPRSLPHRRLRLGGVVGSRLRGGWLLQGEIVFERQGPQRRSQARALGLRVAAIFYDAIPVTHPQWVPDTAIRDNHAAYMRGLAECDRVLPISADAEHQLRAFWDEQHLPVRAQLRHCWIPGELTAAPRATVAPLPPSPGTPLRILCVSTLEPRKNHRSLLAALRQIAHSHPQLDWELHLIGNRYAGAEAIVHEVQAAAAADPRIRWHGVVDDHTLNQHYAQAQLTVYPSLVEGYGMPIVESLWHGRPCVCHHSGVMAQLAEQGGCQTVDMSDASALAHTLVALAGDSVRYAALAQEALARHILTWRGYARALLQQLAEHKSVPASAALPSHWHQLLLPAATAPAADDWPIALATLLRARPVHCALILGAGYEAEAALFAQHVPQAWQLIEHDTGAQLKSQPTVSQLLGPLEHNIPLLLHTLHEHGCTPALILISDHALAHTRVLDYLPLDRLSGCVLIVPQAHAATLCSAVGLAPAAAMTLPGHLAYRC